MKKKISVQVSGIDTTPGEWSVTEKRSVHNRDQFIKFFSDSIGKYGRKREYILENFNVQDIIMLARLYAEHGFDLEEIFSYARKYKKAVWEITETDVSSIEDLLKVREVMKT